jgi:hypothetical protein
MASEPSETQHFLTGLEPVAFLRDLDDSGSLHPCSLGDDGALAVVVKDVADDLYDALVAAKQEMWLVARHQWTMGDFKNWAVVQQIDRALQAADGKQRITA